MQKQETIENDVMKDFVSVKISAFRFETDSQFIIEDAAPLGETFYLSLVYTLTNWNE